MQSCIRIFAGMLAVLFMTAGNAFAQLKADFSATPVSGCSPLTVKFTNLSTGATTYQWSFGNGNSSTLKDPGAIYATPGTFDVVLVAKDANGNIDSVVKKDYVTVYASPVSDFSVDKAGGCSPLNVKFTDKSKKGSGNITNWLWYFGDGGSSTQQNPSHSYTGDGKYEVTLIVTDANGCTSTRTRTDFISAFKPPVITIKATDSNACQAPLKTTFTANVKSASTAPFTYQWDFGDGNTSTQEKPSHTYQSNGSYTVKVKVTDSAGCSNTYQRTNYINIGSETPSFTSLNTQGCPPLQVSFSASSTPGASGTQYIWYFGDGSSSSSRSISHSYDKEGVYDVKLVTISPSGCKDSITKAGHVIVKAAPIVAFKADDTLGCGSSYVIQFTNSSLNYVSSEWDFGDGKKSTETNPSHVYQDTGQYTVTLTVKGSNGCESTLEKTNHIWKTEPHAEFSAGPASGCAPLTVNFVDLSRSVIPIKEWEWDFGDGTVVKKKTPGPHTFTTPGSYTVRLTITNADGCTSQYNVRVNAGEKPEADFTVDKRKGCIWQMEVAFNNLTNTHAVKADSFFWDFGDGATSDKENPIHHYDVEPGKYTVTLVAKNNGCNDTLIMTDHIEILPPYAAFEIGQDPCAPDSVSFTDRSVKADSIWWDMGDGTIINGKKQFSYKYLKRGPITVIQYAYNKTTGCIDTFASKLTVPIILDITVKADVTSGCTPLKVQFNAYGTDSIVTWKWDFGDGATSSDRHPLHIYDKQGKYTVKLTATNASNCTKTWTFPDMISTFGPEAKFGLPTTSGCIPFQVMLIDSSSKANILSKTYDMGNGKKINVISDTTYYTYTTPPADQQDGYTIRMTVVDSQSCSGTLEKTVYPTQPKANFYYNINPSCKEVSYRFIAIQNNAGIGPFTYFWDFGDGTTSKDPIADKKYDSAGKYTVTFVIKDKNGCPDTTRQVLDVKLAKPEASYIASKTDASCPPLLVSFQNTSKPGQAAIVQYEWDFGDGTKSTLKNPNKLYLVPGRFTVSLKVTDALGCTASYVGIDAVIIRGPVGTYSFDRTEGCVPLTVNFKGVSSNATLFEWDMGDGTIYYAGANITHKYTVAGQYIPILILHDSFGCSYPLPRIDTIEVAPPPVPDFTYNSICSGEPTFFTDQSIPVRGIITGWTWNFGDGSFSTEQSPQHVYKKPGWYNVSLAVSTSKGCYVKKDSSIFIRGAIAEFQSSVPTGCIGDPIYFTDISTADTTIAEWFWDFGDSATSKLQNPQHVYAQKGFYDITLAIRTLSGCVDTIVHDKFLVGDTIAPPPPVMYRATVVDDNTVQVEFSRYRDIDFGKYMIYRRTNSGSFSFVTSITSVDDTIFIDNNRNTLHNVYCYYVQVQNVCGFISDPGEEHCTIELTASAGVNKAILSWTPYKGFDSISRYEVYRENIRIKGKFEPVGQTKGNETDFTDTNIICYQTHVYRVQAIEAGGYGMKSWSDSAATTPIYIPNVPATELVRATVEDNKEIKIEWKDLPWIKVRNFILERSLDGINYQVLDSPYDRSVTSVTDEDVKVSERSYRYRVQIIDSCGDAGPYSNIGKTILLKADTTADLLPRLRWTKYKDWAEGVRFYDVEIKNQDGTFTQIHRTDDGEDTVYIDAKTDLNSRPNYCYRVVAYRNGPANEPDRNLHITSTSNEDCVPVRSVIYIPNAFTPNSDSLNDRFIIKGMYIRDFRIKIYDRWGTLVFESDRLDKQWDGYYKEGDPLMDSYKYIVYMKGADERIRHLYGWVTILR